MLATPIIGSWIRRVSSWTVAILISGCAMGAGPQARAGVMVLHDDLRAWLSEAPKSLPMLGGGAGGGHIASCADFDRFVGSGAELGERRQRPEFGAYAPCVAAALLRGAAAAASMPFELEKAGADIFERLDLATVRSSLAPRRPTEHYAFRDFDWRVSRLEPLALRLETGEFRYALDVLAAADFTREGRGQLLVRFSDKAKAGSYDATTILVLRRAPGSDIIEAVDGLDLLRQHAGARR